MASAVAIPTQAAAGRKAVPEQPEQLTGGGSGPWPARGAARRASVPRSRAEAAWRLRLVESPPSGWLREAYGCGKPGFESAREPAQYGVGLHIEGRRRVGGIRARSGAFIREAQQRQKQPIRAVGGFVFPEEAG